MAKYRCPECGASHKENQDYCRLCGAPMAIPVTHRTVAIDEKVAASRFKKKGIGHFAIIGVVIVLAIGIAAVALGWVDGGDEVDEVRGELPFVEGAEDTWFVWPDPDEVVLIELPATPVEVDDPPSLAGAEISAWETSVGDTEFLFGRTEGLDFEDEDDLGDVQSTFDEVADEFAEWQEASLLRLGDPFDQDGHPAANAQYQGLSLPGGPAYGDLRMMIADGELFFVFTTNYQRGSDLHERMADSIVIVADDPDITIPTIPEDAPAPGGEVSG